MCNTHVVKFEDLYSDPIGTMKSMAKFLDKTYTVEDVSHVSLRGDIPHSSWGHHEGMNERWKDWNDDQLSMFYDIAGDSLEQLGYRK